MSIFPRRSGFLSLLVVLVFVCAHTPSRAQSSADGTRRVTARVAPLFPEIARRLSITGAVKVEALVLPNGAVKSVDIKGGHPLLAQSASDAVRKWKWEPAAHETREVVEIRFDPRN